ncbi:MAG: hypothetical protein NVV62_07740 [Terricaulis sp.]|nr:hypothetical protein [Terricaulis sp.]
MTQSLLAENGVRADVLVETPVGRLGAPADIAELAAFFMQQQSRLYQWRGNSDRWRANHPRLSALV